MMGKEEKDDEQHETNDNVRQGERDRMCMVNIKRTSTMHSELSG